MRGKFYIINCSYPRDPVTQNYENKPQSYHSAPFPVIYHTNTSAYANIPRHKQHRAERREMWGSGLWCVGVVYLMTGIDGQIWADCFHQVSPDLSLPALRCTWITSSSPSVVALHSLESAHCDGLVNDLSHEQRVIYIFNFLTPFSCQWRVLPPPYYLTTLSWSPRLRERGLESGLERGEPSLITIIREITPHYNSI